MKNLLKLLSIMLTISVTYSEETQEAEQKDVTVPATEKKSEAHKGTKHHINRTEANKYTKALAAMQTPWTGPMVTISLPACCNHKAATAHHKTKDTVKHEEKTTNKTEDSTHAEKSAS